MTCYLGIGTNLGNRAVNLCTALQWLDSRVGQQIRCSSVYHSQPQGFVSSNEFENIVVSYHTTLAPLQLLRVTQSIEKSMGRTSKSVDGEYHDRIIDIDLLLYYDDNGLPVRMSNHTLTLPHPYMQQRDFVMVPLREIYTDLTNIRNDDSAI